MVKAKIFSFVKVADSSVVASVRVARYVRDLLGLPLAWDDSIADEPLDVLIIVNGAYSFSSCLPAVGRAALEAKKIVWLMNDYTCVPPINDGQAESPFRRAFVQRRERGLDHLHLWSTVPEKITTPLGAYCNWNCLTLDDADNATIARRRRKADEDLLYYGSFRTGRTQDFNRFFSEPRVPTTVSSPSRKFQDSYKKTTYLSKFEGNLYEELGRHGLGLYLEDRWSHSHYCSPANRFYEMMSAGLPMIFQPECGGMMRRAGYDPAPYYCDGARKVPALMELRARIGEEQRERWLPLARQERKKLDGAVLAAWQKMEKAI